MNILGQDTLVKLSQAGPETQVALLGSLGLIGIILHPRLIEYFTKQYLKRKHKMIAAYKAT